MCTVGAKPLRALNVIKRILKTKKNTFQSTFSLRPKEYR